MEQLTDGLLHGITKLAKLNESGLYTEQESHAKDTYHGWNAPDKIIYHTIYFFNDLYYSHRLYYDSLSI